METKKIPTNEKLTNFFEKGSKYNFALFDPRPIDAARESNEKVFQNAKEGVLGIEVTIKDLAEKCTLGNIDPQHTDGDMDKAAIDIVSSMKNENLPKEGVYLATLRADLDALSSMALISLRQKGLEINKEIQERIEKVSAMDRSSRGEWKSQPLPTKENLWLGISEGAEELSGLNVLVMDFKVPMQDRVNMVEKWLEKGKVPQNYVEQAVNNRKSIVQALENGEIKVKLVADDKIAKVESKHMAGTIVGYSLAPTVVVSNPEFKLGGGESHLKHTVCQYKSGYIDLQSALKELNEKENGWGGSPTIIGSPQGISSKLNQEKVIEIVKKYLKN